MRRSPLHSKPASRKPTKPAPRTGVSKLDFLVSFDMITDEEVKAIQDGNAVLVSENRIHNLNADLSFPTGTYEKLYNGRKWNILADRLLGVEPKKD